MHKLLTANPGEKMLLLGNEAIARGAIEAGVAFASTYPGTPSSEVSLNFFQMSQESDLYFEYSTNEKVALEVAAAAANSGVRTMCIMKHVGLNVAADALMTLAYVGVKGGLVIMTADDPFMFSSQNPTSARCGSDADSEAPPPERRSSVPPGAPSGGVSEADIRSGSARAGRRDPRPSGVSPGCRAARRGSSPWACTGSSRR